MREPTSSPDGRLSLPDITVCAVTSVNVAATMRALKICVERAAFADCILLTDAVVRPTHPDIRVVPIDRLNSSAAYSNFLLSKLVDHIQSTHCLIVQWDGHLLNPTLWQPAFLECDYIGASWPQFDDGHDVGNGGFSLRSKRLMEACRKSAFVPGHPEDVAIGRTNRNWLEAEGFRFASRKLADSFATERVGDVKTSFGYHGVFNMPDAIGAEAFWNAYLQLDDIGTIRRDFADLLVAVWQTPHGTVRSLRMIADQLGRTWQSFRKPTRYSQQQDDT